MLIGNHVFGRTLCISLAACCAFTSPRFTQAGAPEPDAPPAKEGVKEVARIQGKGFIAFFAIAPDGKTLAYSDVIPDKDGQPAYSEVILLDLTTGKELQRRKVNSAYCGLFSPDGKLLALGTPRDQTAVTVWDVTRWEPKVKLERPKGHLWGWPLAFSPDGKYVVGRVQVDIGDKIFDIGRHGGHLTDDLALWDLATGDCRVLDSHDLLDNGGPIGVDGKAKELPLTGPFVGSPAAVIFPSNGTTGQLFVESHGLRIFTTLWDVAKGKPLRTEWGGGWVGRVDGRLNPFDGAGDPISGSAAELHRFRTTPAGRILLLPKYDPVPLIAVAAADSTIIVAVRPSEDKYGIVVPIHNFKFAELSGLDDYKGSSSLRCRLTANGKRLVAVGPDPKRPEATDPLFVLRVWDVSALLPEAAKKMTKFAGAERNKLWHDLFKDYPDPAAETLAAPGTIPIKPMPSQEAGVAAALSMSRQPDDAVPWLREKLGPPWDVKKAPQLIEDLESADFKTREAASRQLEQMGPVARPFLERALAKDPPPETKRRVEPLLEKLKGSEAAYELRQLRIIDLLEHIDTAAARELLKQYADGDYDPAFADEAKQALKRVADKP
jgi:WD40 repeat protein